MFQWNWPCHHHPAPSGICFPKFLLFEELNCSLVLFQCLFKGPVPRETFSYPSFFSRLPFFFDAVCAQHFEETRRSVINEEDSADFFHWVIPGIAGLLGDLGFPSCMWKQCFAHSRDILWVLLWVVVPYSGKAKYWLYFMRNSTGIMRRWCV